MNKFLILILFLCGGQYLFGQTSDDSKKETWNKEKDYLKYQKQKKYQGPQDWYGSSPSSINEDENLGSSGPSSQGIQYNPQRIRQDRDRQIGGYDRGGGKGDLKFDPEIKKPDPITFPEVDPPDIDAPDVPDIDPPVIPLIFWQILLFLIIFIVIIVLVYLWLKNRNPANKKIIVDVENEWNPEVVSKTELELRLEEALANDDYREGIRIYFTFILQELIRKEWIKWKKEKTNYHYLLEMRGKNNFHSFQECVRIYELVWYGEYEITKEIYELIQPTLHNYYQSLEPKNE